MRSKNYIHNLDFNNLCKIFLKNKKNIFIDIE